jgi:hypothetical protein
MLVKGEFPGHSKEAASLFGVQASSPAATTPTPRPISKRFLIATPELANARS